MTDSNNQQREAPTEQTNKALVLTLHLPIPLSDSRRQDLGEEVAEAIREYDRLEDLKKRMADEQAKSMKTQRGRMSAAASVLGQGFEMRPVSCSRIFNLSEHTVTTKRLDTGEIVETRPMSADERERLMAEQKDQGTGHGHVHPPTKSVKLAATK